MVVLLARDAIQWLPSGRMFDWSNRRLPDSHPSYFVNYVLFFRAAIWFPIRNHWKSPNFRILGSVLWRQIDPIHTMEGDYLGFFTSSSPVTLGNPICFNKFSSLWRDCNHPTFPFISCLPTVVFWFPQTDLQSSGLKGKGIVFCHYIFLITTVEYWFSNCEHSIGEVVLSAAESRCLATSLLPHMSLSPILNQI